MLLAAGIGWIGVSRWAEFPFMTTGLMFAFPFFLLLIVRKLNAITFAALALLYVSADYAYFTRSGFLIKPYAAPYKEMAEVIVNGSRGQRAILAVDSYGSFYPPLLERLGPNVQVTPLGEEGSREAVTEAARGSTPVSVIWIWRHTRDISPGAFITKLENDLTRSHNARRYEFMPYSPPERWIRRLLRGPGQADYYYRLSEIRL